MVLQWILIQQVLYLSIRIIMMIVGVIRDIVVGIDVIIREIFFVVYRIKENENEFPWKVVQWLKKA